VSRRGFFSLLLTPQATFGRSMPAVTLDFSPMHIPMVSRKAHPAAPRLRLPSPIARAFLSLLAALLLQPVLQDS
jgi:hypothetical protein